jgi:hypothetical protein
LIRQNLTARQENSLIYPGLKSWAGVQGFLYVRDLKKHINGLYKIQQREEFDKLFPLKCLKVESVPHNFLLLEIIALFLYYLIWCLSRGWSNPLAFRRRKFLMASKRLFKQSFYYVILRLDRRIQKPGWLLDTAIKPQDDKQLI